MEDSLDTTKAFNYTNKTLDKCLKTIVKFFRIWIRNGMEYMFCLMPLPYLICIPINKL